MYKLIEQMKLLNINKTNMKKNKGIGTQSVVAVYVYRQIRNVLID